MQAVIFEEVLDRILKKDTRYHRDGYFFLRDALAYTQKTLGREPKTPVREGKESKIADQHVSGQELLAGIRDYALKEFGPMAITVLEEWGIRSCPDFGEMVFVLVEHGLLGKTDKDSRSDFAEGYDFVEVFRKPFLPQNKPNIEPSPEKVGQQ